MPGLPIPALSIGLEALSNGRGVLASASAWAVRPSAASARSAAIQAVFWSAWSRVIGRSYLPSSPSKAWPQTADPRQSSSVSVLCGVFVLVKAVGLSQPVVESRNARLA
jgi:hypothetical protein